MRGFPKSYAVHLLRHRRGHYYSLLTEYEAQGTSFGSPALKNVFSGVSSSKRPSLPKIPQCLEISRRSSKISVRAKCRDRKNIFKKFEKKIRLVFHKLILLSSLVTNFQPPRAPAFPLFRKNVQNSARALPIATHLGEWTFKGKHETGPKNRVLSNGQRFFGNMLVCRFVSFKLPVNPSKRRGPDIWDTTLPLSLAKLVENSLKRSKCAKNDPI